MTAEVYKKQVELLLEVLPIIMKDSRFALKGGCALNLFHLPMPRLSVDIEKRDKFCPHDVTNWLSHELGLGAQFGACFKFFLGYVEWRCSEIMICMKIRYKNAIISSGDSVIKITICPHPRYIERIESSKLCGEITGFLRDSLGVQEHEKWRESHVINLDPNSLFTVWGSYVHVPTTLWSNPLWQIWVKRDEYNRLQLGINDILLAMFQCEEGLDQIPRDIVNLYVCGEEIFDFRVITDAGFHVV